MNDVHVEGEESPIRLTQDELAARHDGRCALWSGGYCSCKTLAPLWDTARTGGLRLPHEDATGDTGLYFAVLEKTGSLCTRGGRPIVATRAQWQELERALKAVAFLPVPPGYFGAVRMLDPNPEPDLIDRLISALSALEGGARTIVDRVEQLDHQQRLSEPPETLGQKLNRQNRIQL